MRQRRGHEVRRSDREDCEARLLEDRDSEVMGQESVCRDLKVGGTDVSKV